MATKLMHTYPYHLFVRMRICIWMMRSTCRNKSRMRNVCVFAYFLFDCIFVSMHVCFCPLHCAFSFSSTFPLSCHVHNSWRLANENAYVHTYINLFIHTYSYIYGEQKTHTYQLNMIHCVLFVLCSLETTTSGCPRLPQNFPRLVRCDLCCCAWGIVVLSGDKMDGVYGYAGMSAYWVWVGTK